MSYSVQLIKKDEQITKEWSGGDTTQLAIYPEDAQYTKRNFLWRISTAQVEAEESDFTPLPDIDRLIMVIEGEMTLQHEGHHRVHLTPYEQDRFNGGWTTRSYGKVRDFNLMLGEGCDGELDAITIEKDSHYETVSSNADKRQIVQAFYCVSGPVCLLVNDKEEFDAENGDLFLMHSEGLDRGITIKVFNKADVEAKVIRAGVVPND
ncbi:HutD/Ves family protein [Sporosarcina cascadiensis]|uniref:HutD/Ves family protein n=1 Tax=Sporosarcina cascadiensis TaxID=2660747 RepID=UPI00129AC4BD|nr:HutD family protein [Sporosarcina cascadiensis]